jgi:hypothetical protein
MIQRVGFIAVIAAVVSVVLVSTAAAQVTLAGSASDDVVDRGATVTDTFTVTNSTPGCTDFCDGAYSLDMLLVRTKSDAAVDDPFLSVTTTSGTCRVDPVDSYGYHYAVCDFGPLSAMPATIQVVATIQANESFDNFAGLGENGQAITDETAVANPVTEVIYPPDVSGADKLVLKGLPPGCASEDLTLKARAPGDIGRFTATLAGPRDEWGANYPDTFGKTIARASGKSKLKVEIPVSKLEPRGFYLITLQAVSKGHPTLAKKVSLQICF